jgi:hypothetical protein
VVTVGAGETKTCTITNNDVAPTLTVIKHVINNNGGQAAAGDWSIHVQSGSPLTDIGSSPQAGSEAGTVYHPAAGTYTASESGGPSGYAFDGFSGDCNATTGVVTLAVGESKTCTLTNNDIAPTLIIKKHVINDNGGGALASAWSLHVQSGSPLADITGSPQNGSETGTTYHPGAGSYSVSETGGPASGYTFDGFSDDCNSSGVVSLGVGETKTCTLTNNDQPGSLIVKKLVINDNGDTKIATDFKFKVNGGTATSFTQDGADTLKGKNTLSVNAGTYSVVEDGTPIYGYTTTYDNCSSVVVPNGGSQTCTITNDDKPGTIIIQKIIKPTGSSTSFVFNTTGTGYTGFSIAGGQQNSQNLNAGSYTAKELVPLGWVLTGIGQDPSDPNHPYDCSVTGSGGSTGVGDLTTQTATISLKNGDTVTCVFENTGVGATRTQGFWATHPQLAQIAWFGGTGFGHTFGGVGSSIGNTSIDGAAPCPRLIDTLAKLMGGFWSDVSKTSTGGKRSALDQARMQLVQQLLAAELNVSAFGSVPASGLSVFTTWENAFCGTNQNAIKNAQQGAASFNTQGDNSTFTPGTSADSKTARSIANYVFWNVLP